MRSTKFSKKILSWYDTSRRVLPWRAPANEHVDPYQVWLSEIMLQQTTVVTVAPYFLKFIKRWPNLADLARSDLDDVLRMWAGLGYYRRARMLYQCAQVVMNHYGGHFPGDESALLKLPGFGPYTAAAVAAIAFDQKANVVDGNVERVMSRLHAVTMPLPKAKKILKEKASALLPDKRCGDYAQALMDLGATICTPRNPKCDLCPVRGECQAHARGIHISLPRKEKKKAKPVRHAFAFVLRDKQGRVYLRKRADSGLLGGMLEVPSTSWDEEKTSFKAALQQQPADANWNLIKGNVRHVFSHFELNMRVAVADIKNKKIGQGRWIETSALAGEALPSIMRKILRQARI